MIEVGGFDLLFGWSGFILLLVILGCFILRSRVDVFEEANRPTSDRPKAAIDIPNTLHDGIIRSDPKK